MNKQEMFTKVWRGLQAQGWQKSEGPNERNRDNGVGCLYRGPNGMKCAAGHLIPDEMYYPEMEGEHILFLLGMKPGIFGEPITQGVASFVYNMQQAHDNFLVLKENKATGAYDDMKSAFIGFAEYHNLTIPGDAT